MKCDCYEDSAGVTLIPHGADPKDHCLIEPFNLVYTIEADTWEECMRIHHEKQGWQPYKPQKT